VCPSLMTSLLVSELRPEPSVASLCVSILQIRKSMNVSVLKVLLACPLVGPRGGQSVETRADPLGSSGRSTQIFYLRKSNNTNVT